MIYNTQRSKLMLPEYGRAIQQMVEICIGISDRAQRQQCAESIINIMKITNPDIMRQPDGEQKLWDQLAIISNYRLAIDYPFDIIKKEELAAKPRPMKYPMQRIRYRHYGHLTESFLKELEEMPAGPERDEMACNMANFMKMSLYNWNRDSLDEQKVETDIYNYTNGEIRLPDEFQFATIASMTRAPKPQQQKKKRR